MTSPAGGVAPCNTGRVRPANVTFSRGVAAQQLWLYGEDELAEVVLGFGEQELSAAWNYAGQYNDLSFELPTDTESVNLGQVACFACMTQIEGQLRPLARRRRRPARSMPAHIRDAVEHTRPSPGDQPATDPQD